MLSEKELTKQIKRLFTLPFAPKVSMEEGRTEVEAAMYELKRVFRIQCHTDAHIIAVVDRVMDTSPRFPAPADIVTAAQDTPDPGKSKGPMGCEVCQGSGWRSFVRRVEPIPGKPYDADYADFCLCAKGTWLRVKEAERIAAKRA